jgi:hypothetical protein
MNISPSGATGQPFGIPTATAIITGIPFSLRYWSGRWPEATFGVSTGPSDVHSSCEECNMPLGEGHHDHE